MDVQFVQVGVWIHVQTHSYTNFCKCRKAHNREASVKLTQAQFGIYSDCQACKGPFNQEEDRDNGGTLGKG